MQNLAVALKRSTLAVMRKRPGLSLLLLFFLFVVWFVNPIREMMSGDDGWAYALTVRALYQTGKYRLHDWAAASMPVQIYLGTLFAQAFGFSFTVLRFSTIILLLVGLISLYHLLRDFGVEDCEASLLTLAVLSCPVVLFLSFTFQTDVQFLGWQILALWLYSRALRKDDHILMGIASVAASAAIGTRQFGVALLGGLVATWLLLERKPLRKVPLYLLGLTLPVFVTAWQFSSAVGQPTFSQKVRLEEQWAYVSQLPQFIADILWRPIAILQYLGLFLLPLAPLLIVLARKALMPRELKSQTQGSESRFRRTLWLAVACSIYVVASVCYRRFVWPHRFLMPYLDWLLPDTYTPFFGLRVKQLLLLTAVTYLLAIILGSLFLKRYFYRRDHQLISREEWFVLLAGMASLALQLLYVQFYDVYLIQFLPFTVVALGKMVLTPPRWCKGLSFAFCLLMLLASSLWTRGNLEQAQANWHAAELARSAGAAPRDIRGDVTWSCYHGAFDEWVAQIGGSDAVDQYVGSNRMHAAFFEFLNVRYAQAAYVLSTSAPSDSDSSWQLRARVDYRDRLLERRSVYLLERTK